MNMLYINIATESFPLVWMETVAFTPADEVLAESSRISKNSLN